MKIHRTNAEKNPPNVDAISESTRNSSIQGAVAKITS